MKVVKPINTMCKGILRDDLRDVDRPFSETIDILNHTFHRTLQYISNNMAA